ncbi:MAG TPA: xanthine dehydrogenase family protein molybdopterin-binding subunit, partial [Candidatus Binataceae bacterium]|nr:xanthine dehydrogenase family protein molybdopterin-binding subunit [Candidatus Binataceae bacterium]
GPVKVTGAARYTYDIELPGLLYGAVLRCPYPHARVKSVDLTAAERIAGVRAAITMDDPTARFAGDEIAAVAATTSDIAADALRAIKVEYEPLPFVVEMDLAAADSAPRVFENRSNVGRPSTSEIGNVQGGLESASATIEATYTTVVQTHTSLETHGAVAQWEGDDQLNLWISSQGIFSARDDAAVYFNLPTNNVRVVTEYMGGGFGSKLGLGREVVIAARLAQAAGAPVKLMLPRADEHVATGNRPNSEQKVRLGADRSGKLTAIELEERGSGGIGAGSGSAGPFKFLYRCPNIRTVETNINLNTGPSAPMRAPGWPQGTFALELAMDELARKFNMDRLEFRRINTDHPVRLREFEVGARAFDWGGRASRARARGALRRGIGVAASGWHTVGVSGPEALAIVNRDGRVVIQIGTQDIGTGTRTVLAMVAAEELGVPLESVTCEVGDTRYPFSVPSGGSMTSPSNTPAVRQAAAHLKDRLFRIAAPLLGAEVSDLEARDGAVRVRFDQTRSIKFADLCRRIPGDSLTAQGEHPMNYRGYRTDQAGCQFAEVEVDAETGVVRVTRVVAVHDAGRIIDPLTARSQINGGVLMGVGYALFEARRMDPNLGLMINPTMDDYKLVGPLDVPDIEVLFVETYNGINNTGVIGLGEAANVATAAAVACAVHDALGVPVRDLPMTPDRVLATLGHA